MHEQENSDFPECIVLAWKSSAVSGCIDYVVVEKYQNGNVSYLT